MAGPLPAAGVQQVAHGLRLGQVQLAVQKGPAGEFSPLGLTGPRSKQGLQPQLQHHGRTVAVDLRRVLPRIAVGGQRDGTQHPVDGHAAAVQQVAIHQRLGRTFQQPLGPQRFEASLRDLRRLGAGQAQDADGRRDGRGGNCGNGIGHRVHRLFLPALSATAEEALFPAKSRFVYFFFLHRLDKYYGNQKVNIPLIHRFHNTVWITRWIMWTTPVGREKRLPAPAGPPYIPFWIFHVKI